MTLIIKYCKYYLLHKIAWPTSELGERDPEVAGRPTELPDHRQRQQGGHWQVCHMWCCLGQFGSHQLSKVNYVNVFSTSWKYVTKFHVHSNCGCVTRMSRMFIICLHFWKGIFSQEPALIRGHVRSPASVPCPHHLLRDLPPARVRGAEAWPRRGVLRWGRLVVCSGLLL